MSPSAEYETGIYYDTASAEDALGRLHALGYAHEDISVMMDRDTRERDFPASDGSKAAEGAATGATVGGVLGAILAGLTATGSIAAIVGTGGLATPLVVGPLAAALAGLGAGGAAGGIVGGLVGAGIPEHRAREYEKGLARGGIVVGVKPTEADREQVATILGGHRSEYDERSDAARGGQGGLASN
jgi:hypothetical protein